MSKKIKYRKAGGTRGGHHRKGVGGTAGKPRGRVLFSTNQRGCGGKISFGKKAALSVARKMRKQTGEGIWAYECVNCGAWHVGHSWATTQRMNGGAA